VSLTQHPSGFPASAVDWYEISGLAYSYPFEDTWHDIILKAMRGLRLDTATLAHSSGLSEEKITSLVEGHCHDATLVAIAPTLGLHPRELVMVARGTSDTFFHEVPKKIQSFTTLYHDMEVHSYLLWSDQNKKAVAFDTGADITRLLERLDRHQLRLDAIFLTHAHADHVAKLSELTQKTDASAWIDQAELIEGTHPLPPHFSYQLDDSIKIETRSTPGHSPGGTTYLIYGLSRLVAVVGDALFARSIGGMSPATYAAGLTNICNKILLLPPSTLLAPGHGPLTTVEEERAKNPFFA
jgi:glyoxylase-like metal-dependent hydrolase (beta-lactamase superfamily II)